MTTLVPKKKARPRAVSEDLPPPPPPMRTIRLEKDLVLGDGMVEWNILDDAREKGMVDDWVDKEADDEDDEGMEVDGDGPAPGLAGSSDLPADVDGQPAAGPSTGLAGLLSLDGDAEEIARRLEEKYGDAAKPKAKVSVFFISAFAVGTRACKKLI